MPVPAAHIADVVDHYLTDHSDQAGYLKPLTEVLAADTDVTARDAWTGHATASAIVEHDGRILIVKHKTYRIWLQPGGHLYLVDGPAAPTYPHRNRPMTAPTAAASATAGLLNTAEVDGAFWAEPATVVYQSLHRAVAVLNGAVS